MAFRILKGATRESVKDAISDCAVRRQVAYGASGEISESVITTTEASFFFANLTALTILDE